MRFNSFCRLSAPNEFNQGLSPRIFWKHRSQLLAASEEDLTKVLLHAVHQDKAIPEQAEETSAGIEITRVGGRLRVLAVADNTSYPKTLPASQIEPSRTKAIPCIILRINRAENTKRLQILKEEEEENVTGHSQVNLQLLIPEDKKSAERAFGACLPLCLSFIKTKLQEDRDVYIACETGRDLSIGVAIAALQAFFDETGSLDIERYDEEMGMRGKHLYIGAGSKVDRND